MGGLSAAFGLGESRREEGAAALRSISAYGEWQEEARGGSAGTGVHAIDRNLTSPSDRSPPPPCSTPGRCPRAAAARAHLQS